MSSQVPSLELSRVLVFGASGTQGGSVVAALLEANRKSATGDIYAIRAVTRNPTSGNAQALSAQGVEVVAGDLDDYDSVLQAFESVDLAFGVTNFWDSFMSDQDYVRSFNIEVQQGKHLADAAAATPTLKHYIWSSLPCVDQSVPHLQSKAVVDDYIGTSHPDLAKKMTLLFLGYYASNLSDYDPPQKDSTGEYIWRQPTRKDAKIPFLGNASVNTGVFAEAIFTHRGAAVGKYVQGMSEVLTLEGVLAMWCKATGIPARFEEVSVEEHKKTFHYGEAFGEELGLNMVYFGAWDEGMKGWTKDGGELITLEELDIRVGDLVGVEETLNSIDWSAFRI